MKLGLILECQNKGADQNVCEHLARMLVADIEIVTRAMDNKPNLIKDCGVVAAQLLKDGCDKVLIIWDLHPATHGSSNKPCVVEDCDQILKKLAEANVAGNVHLVCIEKMLEAWLLADGRALTNFFTTPTHVPERIKDEKTPDTIDDPKRKMMKHFRKNRRGEYNGSVHAEKIVRNIADFSRLRRSATFRRFVLRLTGQEL